MVHALTDEWNALERGIHGHFPFQPRSLRSRRPTLADYASASTDWDSDSDRAVGDPTTGTTTDIASRIADYERRLHRGRVVQEAVFPVGRVPVQGVAATDPVGAIRPDVSYVGRDRQRVNLEVDNRPERSQAHYQEHLQAMRTAQRHGLRPVDGTRSVFVETNDRGQVTRIRKVSYRLDSQGRVQRGAVEDRRLPQPQSLTQVFRSGILNTPPQSRPSAPRLRTTVSGRSRPVRRPRR